MSLHCVSSRDPSQRLPDPELLLVRDVHPQGVDQVGDGDGVRRAGTVRVGTVRVGAVATRGRDRFSTRPSGKGPIPTAYAFLAVIVIVRVVLPWNAPENTITFGLPV